MKTAFFAERAYRHADRIIAISNFTKSELEKKIARRDIQVIPHGIDLTKFSQIHEDSAVPFILSVGALKRRKGYHVAIRAFANMHTAVPNLRYKIVGKGSETYAAELRSLAEQLGVAEKVDFLGGVSEEELLKLYRTARAFMLLSVNEGHHFEGFGLVFLEAAAAGLPVIGTLGNGIADAVKDGANGLLVPQNDENAAAEALRAILIDTGRWNEMSTASHTWANHHALSDMAAQYTRVYTEALSL